MKRTTRIHGSTIGQDREWLEYEKTALLAALSHDAVAGDMSDYDRSEARKRVRSIQGQLDNWGHHG